MGVKLFLNHQERYAITIPDHVASTNGVTYEVEDRIDSGGNAVVHQALNASTGDMVAIKFLLKTSQIRRKRFLKEIQLLKETHHYHIIQYLDNGKVEGYIKQQGNSNTYVQVPYLIMPLADRNLKQLVSNNPSSISFEEYIGQFRGLCGALSVLHKKAIHRDIKPENILIIGDTWVLSDFGLCKFTEGQNDLTTDTEKIGPVYWMSPEAINRVIGNNDEITQASDVYQLCSVFWFVVTKRHPAGCLCPQDWNGSSDLCKLLISSLSHDQNKRPHDGSDLSVRFDNIFNNQSLEEIIVNE